MRALWLDFQRAEPGRRRAGTGLLLTGLVASALLLTDYVSVVGEVGEMESQVSRLRREVEQARRLAGGDSVAMARGGQQQAGDEPAQASHDAAQWESLFSALEKAADETMTLLVLNVGTTDIQISGEARNMSAATDYVKRLQSASAFSNPYLTQSEVVQEHQQHPLRFTLVTSWRESGRESRREGRR